MNSIEKSFWTGFIHTIQKVGMPIQPMQPQKPKHNWVLPTALGIGGALAGSYAYGQSHPAPVPHSESPYFKSLVDNTLTADRPLTVDHPDELPDLGQGINDNGLQVLGTQLANPLADLAAKVPKLPTKPLQSGLRAIGGLAKSAPVQAASKVLGPAFAAHDLAKNNDVTEMMGIDPEKNPYLNASVKTGLGSSALGLGVAVPPVGIAEGLGYGAKKWVEEPLLDHANKFQQQYSTQSGKLSDIALDLYKGVKNPDLAQSNSAREAASLFFKSPYYQKWIKDVTQPSTWDTIRQTSYGLAPSGAQDSPATSNLINRLKQMTGN